MKPYVYQSFWSDRDIEAQPSEIKLVALWLITNPQTSILGICDASSARFSFETGLPTETLQRALEALPKSFIPVGTAVFVRNFIRRQFGAGEALQKNNFFRTMTAEFLSLETERQEVVLAEYQEFSGIVSELSTKPVASRKKPANAKQAAWRVLTTPENEDLRQKVNGLFRRREGTAWSQKEMKALKEAGSVSEEDWELIERYYAKEREKGREKGVHRGDVLTFLNNFTGELDRARGSVRKAYAPPPKTIEPLPDPDWWDDFTAAYPRHQGKHLAELPLRDQEQAKDWAFARAAQELHTLKTKAKTIIRGNKPSPGQRGN